MNEARERLLKRLAELRETSAMPGRPDWTAGSRAAFGLAEGLVRIALAHPEPLDVEMDVGLTGFGPGYFESMRRDTLQALAEDFARVAVEYGVKVSVRCYPWYGSDEPQPDPIVDVWREPTALASSGQEARDG